MKKKRNNDLTKDDALQIVRKQLMQRVTSDIEIQDGIPDEYNLYGMSNKGPCWTARIPSQEIRTGPSRIICISKKTGRVIYDDYTNEE